MVQSISTPTSPRPVTVKQVAGDGVEASPAAKNGKGRAVGLAAQSAVRQAREDGITLPANIQGKVASAIARGIDPASIFAALAAPTEEPVPVEGEPAIPEGEPPVIENIETIEEVIEIEADGPNLSEASDAAIALSLLEDSQ